MKKIKSSSALKAVLFDLDGTLIDTAPDFLYCLNIMRQGMNLPELSIHEMRHHASHGSAQLIQETFCIDPEHATFEDLRQELLSLYATNICRHSRLFPGIEQTLIFLYEIGIAWGIVTNKPERFTTALLSEIRLPNTPDCVVCGDTTAERKPHPEPVLHACKQLDRAAETCLFVGDSINDINAGKSANMSTVLAHYGYLDPQQDISVWQADFIINSAHELPALVKKLSKPAFK